MGWLLRRIDNQYGISFSDTAPPANPDENTYEVVESVALVKPQAQLDAAAAAQVQQAKDQAVALLSQASGQPINLLQRWFAKATVYFLNEIAAGNIEGVTEEQFLAKVLEQQNALSGPGMLIQGGK